MENFKLASKEKLRINFKGVLSTEQLWDLSLNDLDTLAVSLEAELKESDKKTFLNTKSAKDKTAKLKFDVVLEVLTFKMEEAQAAASAKEIKEHNNKILTLIAEKKDASLKGKSEKQLKAMLK